MKQDVSSKAVARRFWCLLALVLVLAVFFSALAVRFTATPYLAEQQRQAITEQALKDARSVEATLSRYRIFQSIVASDPDVITTVLGYNDNARLVIDFFESLQRPVALSWLALYDVFGGRLAQNPFQGDATDAFASERIKAIVQGFEENPADAQERVLYEYGHDDSQTLVFVPVLNNGLVEGVLVGGYALDLTEALPDHDNVRSTYFVRARTEAEARLNAPENAVIAKLADADFALVQVPESASVSAAGNALMQRTAGVIALVLVGAFSLFAWLGRTTIVEPHRRLAEQQQSLSELATIAERADDAILVTDQTTRVRWVNPAFSDLTGYTIDEIAGKRSGLLLRGPDTDPIVAAQVDQAMQERRPIRVEILNYGKLGKPYWASKSVSPLYDDDGGTIYGFVTISRDITESRRQREEILAAHREIEHQAYHDPLTGLPNRRALDLALQERRNSDALASTIVRVDLDRFKYVNDTMGHEAGDFVLCEVANIIRTETKIGDLPARVGGDEFVILLSPGMTDDDGLVVANRMLDRICSPKVFEDKTLRVGASFGIASTADRLLGLDELIIGADAALYDAKGRGRSTVRLYSPELHREVLGRRALAREIRRGIGNDEFEPYFQPQVDARTGQIVGVETLARWHSSELGVLAPGAFMPVAQHLSVIDEIDAIIFRKAIDQIVGLRERGVAIPKVSFNVTAERIQSQDSFEIIKDNLSRGPRISFEILESVLVEEQSDLFSFSLDRLRESGVMIEIDDFGSGHASIIGLKQLLPDAMKVDQRLIQPITTDPTARGMLKQIIGMADLLGLSVTAEGVETLDHARVLTDLGCDTLQGHAFAKAMMVEDLYHYAMKQQPSDTTRAG
ncbi:MAG: EAL domain-containing protein [Pseudomonadota bacterium]